MSLREYRPLTRETDIPATRVLRIKYYIICEGQNTEWIYFKGLCENRKNVGIKNTIEIVPLEKTGIHQHCSNPKKLFELAREKKKELQLDPNSTYSSEVDKFVIVFDLDIYNRKNKQKDFYNLLAGKKEDELLAVTNPCFDMWLLLHAPNAYKKHIQGDEKEILINKKNSKKHTYMSKKASTVLGFFTKGEYDFTRLQKHINNAIKEERFICEDCHTMLNTVGCNVGLLLNSFKKDYLE